MSRSRLDDRYELLDELPHVTGGRLFRARDLAFGEIVGVKQLGVNCGLEGAALEHLENTIRHLQCLPHPNLAHVDRFDAYSGLMVQEWVQGISLLDLLRRRRELSLHEALSLLAKLPSALDFLAQAAVPIPRPLLGKLYVEFSGNVALDAIAATPLDRWPPYALKLNPLSLRGIIGAPVSDETTHTVVVDPRHPMDIQEGYGPREFALLLYELLGGRVREVDGRRYVPLGALGEAGNAVMRRELLGMPHADCESLWQDLLHSQSGSLRLSEANGALAASAGESFQIPAEYVTAEHPGLALRLEPVDSAGTAIHLVARPRFTIGRSAAMADFIARILPENETNNARTNRLSRIHVLLEVQDGQIVLRDGNGSGPSLNGSFLDSQALTPSHQTVLPQRARLSLGGEYVVDLVPVAQREPANLEISNIHSWNGPHVTPPPVPWAALILEPAWGQGVSRQSVWLFSEIGFGFDARARLVWDARGRGVSPASFHYYRGCFWLRNRSLSTPILVGSSTVLGHGEILPLVPDQIIRLGEQDFTVHVE